MLSHNATNRIRLSPKCEVEVSNLGSMGLAAKFYGENKLIYEGKSKVESKTQRNAKANAEGATARGMREWGSG